MRQRARQRSPYHDDPVGWVNAFVRFPRGQGLAPYQAEVLQRLVSERRVAQRGPHGLGKTATKALATLWFAETRERAGIDWKVVTTAGGWRQLERFLWPEVHKWVRCLDWEALGVRPWKTTELLTLSLKLTHGSAFPVAATNADLIEGGHATDIFYIFDESKAIPADVFDSAEGAFSIGNAYAFASSTPGDPAGRFYDIHARKAGYEDWWVRHVTMAEAIAAGRMSPEWAEQRRRQWGENSALYHNRVLGEFFADSERTVIPLPWVEAAVERWHQWNDAGAQLPEASKRLGVDVARGGGDQCALATRYGDLVVGVERPQCGADTMRLVGEVIIRRPDLSIVDVIGIGAGVYDRLAEQDYRVEAFNASAGTSRTDRSGTMHFVNCRAAAWWGLRELLDPAFGPTLALPDDDLLIGDLVAPHWWTTSTGKIAVESKDDIRSRIGRSTDSGDAVVQSYWEPEPAKARPRMSVYA